MEDLTDLPISPDNAAYWADRYANDRTGWDVGYPTTPLKTYFDQLVDKDLKILIPGAGNAYEAEYLWKNGFTKVWIVDIAKVPLDNFASRVPDFPREQLIQADFFKLDGCYDLIIEQTFFCSFEPTAENRNRYAEKVAELLKPGGRLVGLWFTFPLTENSRRPFGGTREEYESYLAPYLSKVRFAPSYNSIPPRRGNELFGIWRKEMG